MNYSFSKDNDWLLIITTFLLAAFGLIMVFSSSYVLALYEQGDYYYFIKRQLMWFGLASVAFALIMHFPYAAYRKLSPFIVGISILLLALVLFVGTEVKGAQRWLQVGPLRMQPSEFVKIGIIIYLAQVYSSKQAYINQFVKGLLPPLIVVCVILGLIMGQPDLGTATSILLVTGLIVFFSGAKFTHLIGLGAIGASLFTVLAVFEPYRFQRLVGFRDPFANPVDSGYQLIQSYVAISHGGLTGTGLGQSVQKLLYLPEPHTDFILAIISEELGLFGVAFIFVCYFIILVKGVLIGAQCKSPFGSLLAYGIVFQIAIQVVFNVGAVAGMLPITGIPLPFISNGGSSLLVSLVSIAILANISKHNQKIKRMKEDVALSA